MKNSTRGFSLLAAMLLIGFLAGVACDRAANKPATAAGTTDIQEATAEKGSPTEAAETNQNQKVQRFGMVIGLKKDMVDRYNELHANPWPEINAMIKRCNIRDYSIYECELDGKLYLFSYFEYVGDDFKKDMAVMAADAKTRQWWAETDPCQIRLPGTPEGEQWLKIQEVYHLD
jgi:L-rhamnose mutarotase